jgi:transposase
MMIDYQAVKNTCNASKNTSGFCFYKNTNGIKRHLAVDTLGLPFFIHCTPANISDYQGLIEMLTANIDYFKSKPMNVPKITILLDNGYHKNKITTALTKVYPSIMRKIKIQLSQKPSKKDKAEKGQSGFVSVAARWIIERSNSWMERCKILVKNYEKTLKNANTKIQLCFLRIALRSLSS